MGGGIGRVGEEEGEEEEGGAKKKKRKNDLVSVCAVVILKMLNWVEMCTPNLSWHGFCAIRSLL